MKLSKATQFSPLIYWNILIWLESLTEVNPKYICRAEPHVAAGTLADNEVTATAEEMKAGEVETNKVRRISEIYLRSQNLL